MTLDILDKIGRFEAFTDDELKTMRAALKDYHSIFPIRNTLKHELRDQIAHVQHGRELDAINTLDKQLDEVTKLRSGVKP